MRDDDIIFPSNTAGVPVQSYKNCTKEDNSFYQNSIIRYLLQKDLIDLAITYHGLAETERLEEKS